MATQSEVKQWGNSLALRIPSSVAKESGFKLGSRIEVVPSKDKLLIKKLKPKTKPRCLPYTEAVLLEGLTPETAHADTVPSVSIDELGC